MTLRDWMDPRDGRHWKVQQTGLPTLLVFASKDDLFSVVVDFNNGLEDRHAPGRVRIESLPINPVADFPAVPFADHL